ncbi:MAG: hypothetical protein LJE96_10960 [Deltaproteobacteria bacterium]|nr:hypothetical protein [Deltaproteobacteria bacterium]
MKMAVKPGQNNENCSCTLGLLFHFDRTKETGCFDENGSRKEEIFISRGRPFSDRREACERISLSLARFRPT